MAKAKKSDVFVYHDSDHGDLEVFKSLAAAKKHGEVCWDVPEEDDEGWEDCGNGRWSRCEYQTIYQRRL